MKIAFVTNFCPHYRIKLFELLAHSHNMDFYFYSEGNEWYWQQSHGFRSGNFNHQYLSGFQIGKTRITPSLLRKLSRNPYDVYIKCINGKFALPITYLIARIKHKPFILWTGIWTRINKPIHNLFFPITRYIYRHADAVVVYGQHVKHFLIDEGVKENRIFIANHAVDNSIYNRKVEVSKKDEIYSRLNIPKDSKIVLYLGRLEAVKGIPYLIDAFNTISHKDVTLVLAGNGSNKSELEKLVYAKGIMDRVRFPGYIPIEESIVYYATAWVLVLPSVTTPEGKELWGLVVNEAMNQGVPIIATDVVGAAAGGLVIDGINGYIVPERDSRALSCAIEKLLSDTELHDRLGTNSKELIAVWNNELMVKGFLNAIESVMTKHE